MISEADIFLFREVDRQLGSLTALVDNASVLEQQMSADMNLARLNRVFSTNVIVLLQRGGQPKEVAQAVLWLLSDKSSFTTGIFINVTGGV
ncbi:hypothetical protein S7335_4520 [Synechococcus sp. PCC 7335]|uniref:SDR family oxidoreductase n=1 Tax=Synechococcus sp. (strain ATCC 29403 / PCC 7335) TaxID=91464 RepID=UPI00017ED93E|nr:SDR family oxidoreductase [Synechococcus sp. PCC 7335]EDX86813.1 hypothetical protein S7335_4520 [Synechococcus sp. PCC 7335]